MSVPHLFRDGVGSLVGDQVRGFLDDNFAAAIPFGLFVPGDPTGTLDMQPALQAAALLSRVVRVGTGTFRLAAAVTALTVQHTLIGEGIGNSFFTTAGNNWAFDVAAPATDTRASLWLSGFTVLGKFAVKVGGTRASNPTDGAIIGCYFSFGHIGTYGAGSGDPAYNTNLFRNTSNALVAVLPGATNLSALNNNLDIASYGISLQLSKCFDSLCNSMQIFGSGVNLQLLGSDIVKWLGGRVHEVGNWFYTERIGTFGSQLQVSESDLLHSRRAGGFTANQTKFDRMVDCYHEGYTDASCWVYLEFTEGFSWRDCRMDDPYFGTTGTTPLVCVNTPAYNNLIRYPQYQKFSAFTVPIPPTLVIGSLSACDTNHPELVSIVMPDAYAPIRFTAPTIGCRTGELDRRGFSPVNVPGTIDGNITPLGVLDGTALAFHSASAQTYGWRFYMVPLKASYVLGVLGRTASGTTLTVSVQHFRADGTFLENLNTAPFGGFSTGGYSFAAVTITLGFELRAGDYFVANWVGNTGWIQWVELQ